MQTAPRLRGSSAKRFMPRKLSLQPNDVFSLITLVQFSTTNIIVRSSDERRQHVASAGATGCSTSATWPCTATRTSPTATTGAQHAGRQQKRRPGADPGERLSSSPSELESRPSSTSRSRIVRCHESAETCPTASLNWRTFLQGCDTSSNTLKSV